MNYTSTSVLETKKIASELAKKLQNGGIVALTGPLGAGKTHFTQGFAQGLGIKESLISPTFILIRYYHIPNTNRKLFHIDLYRLENLEEIKNIGIEDILTDPAHLVLVEWAEKISKLLPENSWKVEIKPLSENGRQIKITGPAFV